jgi:hypothetical protein
MRDVTLAGVVIANENHGGILSFQWVQMEPLRESSNSRFRKSTELNVI